MNRLIYLWELDSVRGKDADKENGVLKSDAFEAIHREIVKNGNSVAVTMNQLTDSSFFAQVFNDGYAYESVLRLFELGALRVSLFRDKNNRVRTASQYVQNALISFKGEANKFVFSNFPIKGSDTPELKETVLNALRYSDLSELRELCRAYMETDAALAARIETIIKFVNIILTLSVSETANVPFKSEDGAIKDAKRSEEADKPHTFVLFMRSILAELAAMKDAPEAAELYREHSRDIEAARRDLSARMRELEGSPNAHKRSAWLYENKKQIFFGLTEELIHVCYNYTVEDSISGACLHFDRECIRPDLYMRLRDYYERREQAALPPPERVKKHRFRTLLRFAEYRATETPEPHGNYSEVLVGDRLRWQGFIILRCLRAFAWAILYIALFFGTELLSSFLESTLSITVPNGFMTVLINVVAFGILGSLIGFVIKKINKNHDVPDIIESIVDIFVHVYDLSIVVFGGGK